MWGLVTARRALERGVGLFRVSAAPPRLVPQVQQKAVAGLCSKAPGEQEASEVKKAGADATPDMDQDNPACSQGSDGITFGLWDQVSHILCNILLQGARAQANGLGEEDLAVGRTLQKESDIPEIVSFEMLDSAKSKVRVKVAILLMLLTIVGCITMVTSGKRAVARHESLASLNLERKARLQEESKPNVVKAE